MIVSMLSTGRGADPRLDASSSDVPASLKGLNVNSPGQRPGCEGKNGPTLKGLNSAMNACLGFALNQASLTTIPRQTDRLTQSDSTPSGLMPSPRSYPRRCRGLFMLKPFGLLTREITATANKSRSSVCSNDLNDGTWIFTHSQIP